MCIYKVYIIHPRLPLNKMCGCCAGYNIVALGTRKHQRYIKKTQAIIKPKNNESFCLF